MIYYKCILILWLHYNIIIITHTKLWSLTWNKFVSCYVKDDLTDLNRRSKSKYPLWHWDGDRLTWKEPLVFAYHWFICYWSGAIHLEIGLVTWQIACLSQWSHESLMSSWRTIIDFRKQYDYFILLLKAAQYVQFDNWLVHCLTDWDTWLWAILNAEFSISLMWSHAYQNHWISISYISKTCEDFGTNRWYVLFCQEMYMHKKFHDCRMTQPIKSIVDYNLIQSCEWILLLLSHMIAYIKTANYNSESIQPMDIEFFCA